MSIAENLIDSAGQTLRSVQALTAAGLLPPSGEQDAARVAERYAIALTPALAALIDRADPNDPIARQFVPSIAELESSPQERPDPIGDAAHSPLEGLVHRYPDRVLLKLVNVCAVYCRFCFRREMVGPAQPGLSDAAFATALDYIRARPQIWEVILSGGDPLVLSSRRLQAALERIGDIAHVKVVRVHTRLPVAAPERITAALVRALRSERFATYVVLHANHARELSAPARAACARIVDAGIPMLSQSVLMRGVNDDVDTLADLMRAFVACRIKPYYLHHPDLAPGTAHFRLGIAEGQALMRGLRARVSGLCQPHYVLDVPDGHGKVPVGPNYLSPATGQSSGAYWVEDPQGRQHLYDTEHS